MNLNRCCYLLLIAAAIGCIFTSWPFAIWLLLVNVLTLAIYGVDKIGGAQGLAQGAGVHVAGVWARGRLGWRDSGSAAVPPQNAKAAIQDLVHHQRDRQSLRDGGDLCALSFFFLLISGEANGLQKRGMHSIGRYS